ncbi:MAG: GNAT family N-acetyltransferase, partial [Pseudohongiellaceae bacterium]
ACPRPLGGCDMGFLDDMFVSPDARGSGAADALFAGLQALAEERGWPALRWITQHFNERARAFYDRYTGGPSDFIMYQLKRG